MIFRFAIAVVALLIGAPALSAADALWFRRALVGMEVGPTGAQFGHSDTNDSNYASQFSGVEIVRRCAEAGSEYVVAWARDGDYAYYNSKLLPKPRGLGERDPLREAVDEARRRKLPLIAYCVVQQGGHFLKEHPEWEMKGADGKSLGRFCLNSGYLEAMKAIVSEQLSYGVDGFHIDMLDQGFGAPYGCYCDKCKTQFEAEFKRAMPTSLKWDEAWDDVLEFRYRSSERFEKALAAHIKSNRSTVTVDFNYHGNPPFSFEVGQRPAQHATNADFVTGETGTWGFSALTVGLNAEFYRAAAPGRPFQVAMQRGVRMYHDQTTRPLADLRWELFTLLSHGAFVTMVDKTAYDGALDPNAYDRVGSAFREARMRRSHFGQEPVQDVGIYFSSRTRDWLGRESPGKYFQSFLGAHKALVYEHIPWGVVLDENATPERLRAFPVLLLPNTSILSAPEIARLKQYVTAGGKLVLTGFTGTHGSKGEALDASPLAELVGGTVQRRLESHDNWVRFGNDESPMAKTLRGGIATNWPFLVEGPAVVWKATTATPIGDLLAPSRTPRQLAGKEGTEWPMSAGERVGPAVLVNRVGQGLVMTFASSPDFATASDHHIVEARTLLKNAVECMHPRRRVRIQAPTTVEAVVTNDPRARSLRIHLLGYNSAPQTMDMRHRPFVLPNPIEEAPMFRVDVLLNAPVRSASSANSLTQIQQQGSRVRALVSDVHDVLVLSY